MRGKQLRPPLFILRVTDTPERRKQNPAAE